MARIAGIDLPKNKRLEVALTYIYGIGPRSARKILEKAGVNPNTRVSELPVKDASKIRSIIASDYKVEGSLRTEVSMNIRRLMDIGCYRGLRHRKSLPVRGQRTRTNARTHKGKRTPIGGRKK